MLKSLRSFFSSDSKKVLQEKKNEMLQLEIKKLESKRDDVLSFFGSTLDRSTAVHTALPGKFKPTPSTPGLSDLILEYADASLDLEEALKPINSELSTLRISTITKRIGEIKDIMRASQHLALDLLDKNDSSVHP